MKNVKNIFLVDDDEIFVYLTKKTIEETRLIDQIKTFGNGKDAIDYLEQIAGNKELLPEVIFLDLHMPVLDGWGFLEDYVRLNPKLGKKITLYIFTSSVSQQDIMRAHEISLVTDYIIKPMSKDKFTELIGKI